jgi:organic hydroperoxide reductase OsmC/OhrA
MSEHRATITWARGDASFTDNRYSRAHAWRFDGGAEIAASASPALVAAPWSDPRGVDPEEAFVASLASCHMLWFLWCAARAGVLVDAYEDDAVGLLGKDAAGRLVITRVTLRPLAALHHDAHERCFLAASVKCEVVVTPR